MSDQFFIEEDEQQPAAPAAKAKAAPKAAAPAGKAKFATGKPQPSADGIKPPTFGMVVAIAAVALVLGMAIGYFAGMYVASNSAPSQPQAVPSQAAVATSAPASSDSDGSSMPEGHPDLSQFTNPDGTINEEALAEYRAERAAQTSTQAQ